ncbi:MAG: glycosyltransferase [Terracidiphilus sp.]
MKISVIIPAYNAEPYLAEAIASCLEQTEPADEIVVADDGSTDRTAEIAKQFSSQVKLVRLEKNCGLPSARNRAIEASTGDWLAFLDADDWFLPRKLELQRRSIQENPNAVLVYSGFRLRFPDGSERDGEFVPPGELHWRLRYHCPFQPCSVMLRRDAFNVLGGFDPDRRRCEDWDLWLRLASRFSADAFAAVPEPLVAYRQTPGSLSSNAMRMYEAKAVIIESRSLYRTSGLNRFLLRRRLHAFNRYDAAVALREQGSAEYLNFVLSSLLLWPFPDRMLPLARYKTAAVMFLQSCRLWPNPFLPKKTSLKDAARGNRMDSGS